MDKKYKYKVTGELLHCINCIQTYPFFPVFSNLSLTNRYINNAYQNTKFSNVLELPKFFEMRAVLKLN